MLGRAVTRELPDNIPFVVTQSLIHSAIDLWQEPAMRLFDYVEEILSTKVADFVHAECSQYPQLEGLVSYVPARRRGPASSDPPAGRSSRTTSRGARRRRGSASGGCSRSRRARAR